MESKRGKVGQSPSERPQRRWRVAHLKDGSGATPMASRPESGGTGWLQASARHNLRGGGERNTVSYGGPNGETTAAQNIAAQRWSARCDRAAGAGRERAGGGTAAYPRDQQQCGELT
jgi:hypothetical protein